MSMIDLTKPLTTANGLEVTLTQVVGEGQHPLRGEVEGATGEVRWTLNGLAYVMAANSVPIHTPAFNLVTKAQTRTIVQALYPLGTSTARYDTLAEAKRECGNHRACQGYLTLHYVEGRISSVTIHPKD